MGLFSKLFGKKEAPKPAAPGLGQVDPRIERVLFPADGEQNDFRLWCLGMSSPLGAKNWNACNKLGTGETYQAASRRQIESDWGVHSAKELREQVDELLKDGANNLDDLVPLINGDPSAIQAQALQALGYKDHAAESLAKYLPQAMAWFQRARLPLPSRSFYAWDIVRAAYLMHSAYSAGYVPEEECFYTLAKIGAHACRYYHDWEDYAVSYLFRRMLWVAMGGGYNGEGEKEANEAFRCVYTLLHSSKSFCTRFPFDFGIERVKQAQRELDPDSSLEVYSVELKCPACGQTGVVPRYAAIDTGRYPDLKEQLLSGRLFRWSCPFCGKGAEFGYACTYRDPAEKLSVIVNPHFDAEALESLNQHLKREPEPGYLHRVVSQFPELQELVRTRDAGLDDRVVNMVKVVLLGMLQASGKQFSCAYFTHMTPAAQKSEGHVAYVAEEGKEAQARDEAILWFEIRMNDGKTEQDGINFHAYQKYEKKLMERMPGEDELFLKVDFNWALQMMK